jgi:hypothetical protein
MSDYGKGYQSSHHGRTPGEPWSPGKEAGHNAARTHEKPREQFAMPDVSIPEWSNFKTPPGGGGRGGTGPGPSGGLFDWLVGDTSSGRANRIFAAIGTIGGLGYGIWQAFAVGVGLGSGAVIVRKFTALGALAGLLFLMGLAAAASLALLAAILWGIAFLVNFLAG